MLLFLVLTAVTFSLFGFIIGIWADGFEKLQLIPMLIVMPLTFLGGPFYSIKHAAADLAEALDAQPLGVPDQRVSAGVSSATSEMHIGVSFGGDAGVLLRRAVGRDLDHENRLAHQGLSNGHHPPFAIISS